MEICNMLEGIWHFSFTVSNLDQAVKFYTELLEFECVHTQIQDNEYTRRLVGYPDAKLRIAQLVAKNHPLGVSNHHIELVEYISPKGRRQDENICNPGAAHLAIVVDDIHAAYKKLKEAGVEFFSEPNYITEGINKGGYTVYFYGPDRIVHELVQPPKREI